MKNKFPPPALTLPYQHSFEVKQQMSPSTVFIGVTHESSEPPSQAHSPAYLVKAPCASDAVSLALRCAYADESGLPDDMASMLRQLNQVDSATH